MTEQIDETNMKPTQLLQQSADQLAQKHQQRLHQMTRQAVYGAATEVRAARPWLRWPTLIAAPLASVLTIVVVWQLSQQLDTDTMQPTMVADSTLPAWVQDTEVPVAVISNIEFYQWLEDELDKQDHS